MASAESEGMQPEDVNQKHFGGTDGVADEDGAAWGGPIDLGAELDEGTPGIYFQNTPIPQSGPDADPRYGGFYRLQGAGVDSILRNARFAARSAARPNTASGLPNVVSTSAEDTGTVVCANKVGGVWANRTKAVAGTSPQAFADIADAFSCKRWQYVVAGSPTKPKGNIFCYVGTELCAIIWGTNDLGTSRAITMCTAEYRIALADAINQEIGSADRLVEPADISAFDYGNSWPDADDSLPVPGGELAGAAADVDADFIGVVIEFTGYSGIPMPVGGKIVFAGQLMGTPDEV